MKERNQVTLPPRQAFWKTLLVGIQGKTNANQPFWGSSNFETKPSTQQVGGNSGNQGGVKDVSLSQTGGPPFGLAFQGTQTKTQPFSGPTHLLLFFF